MTGHAERLRPPDHVLLDAADLGEVLDVAAQRPDAAGLPLAHREVAAVPLLVGDRRA